MSCTCTRPALHPVRRLRGSSTTNYDIYDNYNTYSTPGRRGLYLFFCDEAPTTNNINNNNKYYRRNVINDDPAGIILGSLRPGDDAVMATCPYVSVDGSKFGGSNPGQIKLDFSTLVPGMCIYVLSSYSVAEREPSALVRIFRLTLASRGSAGPNAKYKLKAGTRGRLRVDGVNP